MRRRLGLLTPYHIGLILAFALALGLRVVVASVFLGLGSAPRFSAQPDQIDYEQLAFSMSTGAGYATPDGLPTARRPPGTSLTLLPAYAAAGRSFTVGRLWFCLLSALTCLAAAWLAAQCFGPAAGLVSAFWLALYPGHFYYPMHFVSEVPYGFWLTLACGSMVSALRDARHVNRFTLLAGACLGLAVLTRPQIALVVPIAGLLALLSRRTTRQELIHLATAAVVMGAVLLPWVVRNTIVMGKPTLSTVGGVTFWGANNETVLNDPQLRGLWLRSSDLIDDRHPLSGTEIEKEEQAWQYGVDFVARNAGRMPGLVAMKVWRLVSPFEATENRVVWWTFAVAWLFTVPWAVAGIVLALKDDRDRIAGGVLLVPLAATLMTTLVFYGSIRFRDSIIPLLVVLAARALVRVAPRLRAHGITRLDDPIGPLAAKD